MANTPDLKEAIYRITAIILAYHRDEAGYDTSIRLLMQLGLTEAEADRMLVSCSSALKGVA